MVISNPVLFTTSTLFMLVNLYTTFTYKINLKFSALGIIAALTSMLNHGIKNSTLRLIDRIYIPFYIISNVIKILNFKGRKKYTILGLISAGVSLVLTAMYIRYEFEKIDCDTEVKRKLIFRSTFLHLCSHFILITCHIMTYLYLKNYR